MTEMPQQPAEEPTATGPEPAYEWKGADTTGGASEEEAPRSGRATGREWLDQLQGMIDDLATQAAPVVRQVGAKAAELAALAGEKAGPIAHRAADATETAGIRLAERSRQLAEDLKHRQADAGATTGAAPTGTETGSPGEEDGA